MKKILSLTLAALMVVSMIPTAFAAEAGGNWAGGTQVEATGSRSTVEDDGAVTHNAEYTITVPALLAPGGSGTVTLEGYWPSDATVKVTAEEKVEVVSDINSADKKELAVNFASIEKAGSNTAVVTASAPVSVANIENALFGKWAGKFNYNVDYVAGSGNTGDSGTTEPSDPDTGDDEAVTLVGSATFSDGVTLSWDELQREENATKYGYSLPLTNNDGTIISLSCFQGNKNITSIVIPDGITTIGQSSFQITASNQFTNATIPVSVTLIKTNAFSSNADITFNYMGTQEQWNAIEFEYHWAGAYPNITVICTDGTINITEA